MKVGIVKEIKNNENRVAIIPASVKEFLRYGHEVYIAVSYTHLDVYKRQLLYTSNPS